MAKIHIIHRCRCRRRYRIVDEDRYIVAELPRLIASLHTSAAGRWLSSSHRARTTGTMLSHSRPSDRSFRQCGAWTETVCMRHPGDVTETGVATFDNHVPGLGE